MYFELSKILFLLETLNNFSCFFWNISFKAIQFINLYNIKIKLPHMDDLTVEDIKKIKNQDKIVER